MAQVPEQNDWVLALAPGCDAEQLVRSTAEGYLFSRIDGVTPWRLLREIGGIPAEQVDACLRRWLDDGALDVVGGRTASTNSTGNGGAGAPADPAEAPANAPVEIDEGALDDRLDIGLDVQRRILEYEASLGRPYHELLGVQPGATPKDVKKAYFKLSKEFHPDRYFRKQIGSFGERLDRIFKKVLEAHEILSDPELCQVANQSVVASVEAVPPVEEAPPVDAAAVPESSPAEPERGAESTKPEKPRPLTKLERLKQRMPFKINHAALYARRQQADEIFRAAQASQQAGRLQEAEASLRIAITFDPARAEFKEALGSLKIAAAGARAANLLAKPSERMSDSELFEALRLIEEVLPYRPHDPELNERAGRICLRLEKYADAREYIETLLIRQPESAQAYTMLGRIHKAQGDLDAAVRAFETALKFDEDDLEARRSLAAVRIGARDAARGGETS